MVSDFGSVKSRAEVEAEYEKSQPGRASFERGFARPRELPSGYSAQLGAVSRAEFGPGYTVVFDDERVTASDSDLAVLRRGALIVRVFPRHQYGEAPRDPAAEGYRGIEDLAPDPQVDLEDGWFYPYQPDGGWPGMLEAYTDKYVLTVRGNLDTEGFRTILSQFL